MNSLMKSAKFCSDTTDRILVIQKDLKELKGRHEKTDRKNFELERENETTD